GARLRHHLPSSLAPASLPPQSRRRRAPQARCALWLADGARLRHHLPSSLAPASLPPQSRRRRAPPPPPRCPILAHGTAPGGAGPAGTAPDAHAEPPGLVR